MTSYDQVEHAARTDVGVRRNHNQDSHSVVPATDNQEWARKGHIFMVADGMGAHAVGEMASAMACNIVPLTYGKHAPEGVPTALRKAITEANHSIHDRGQKNREFEGMGTTSTCLVLRPEGAWVGHVGDSRAYRVRNGKVQQLTFDHSLLWEKARRAKVKPEELRDVPHNVIVRSLGPDPEVEPDIQGPHPYEEGDTFVLCSDGLSGPLSDEEIGAVVGALPPAEAAHFLVEMANLRGGPDNITVVVARVGNRKNSRGPLAAPVRLPGGPAWYTRVPWPLWILLAGVLLAAAAVGLIVGGSTDGGQLMFVLALLAIVGGVVALVIYHKQEKERAEKQEPVYKPRVKIYRETPCAIDAAILGKLQKVELMLAREARAREWDLDWDAHQKHHALMEKQVTKGDLPAAFRECCRAMKPLTEALAKQRHKEEMFTPNWDRTGR